MIKQKKLYQENIMKYGNTNIVSPISLGFNGVLVVYPTKAGEKEN